MVVKGGICESGHQSHQHEEYAEDACALAAQTGNISAQFFEGGLIEGVLLLIGRGLLRLLEKKLMEVGYLAVMVFFTAFKVVDIDFGRRRRGGSRF